jgi:hypothetical protein
VSQELLRSRRIVPEILPARLFLQFRQLGAFCIGVKDTSEVLPPAPPVQCILL